MPGVWEITLANGEKEVHTGDRCWVEECGAICIGRDDEEDDSYYIMVVTLPSGVWIKVRETMP